MGSRRRIPYALVALTAVGAALIAASFVAVLFSISPAVRQQTLFAGVSVVLGSAVLWLGPVRRRPAATYWAALALGLAAGVGLAVLNYSSHTTANRGYPTIGLIPSMLFVVVALGAARRTCREPASRRLFVFQHVLAGLMLVTVLVGVEMASGFVVPRWPARELRPVHITKAWADAAGGGFNSWGMRDVEHDIEKPANTTRVLFIGDSFLEGIFSRNALPGYCREELQRRGETNFELVNLGIVATNPAHYFYRLRNVGLALSPDAVFVFLYMGNDMIQIGCEDLGFPFVEERPLPSMLGAVMPRVTWLVVERLNLSELRSFRDPVPNEFEDLRRISEMPYEQGIAALAERMHHDYATNVSTEDIERILRQGGERFWEELRPREVDRQYLLGWRIASLVSTGLARERRGERSPEPAANVKPNMTLVRSTMSWVEAIARDLESAGIPLYVFLAPSPDNMDPDYRDFWRPWYGGERNPKRQVHRRALLDGLTAKGIVVVDLADVLEGVPNSHRKFDRHWNELGHALVAGQVVQTMLEWRDSK